MRWAVVGIGYVLAASVPRSGTVRLVLLLLGLCFLCWPNLAYHVTSRFTVWPTTKGRVVSAAQFDSSSVIIYSFELGGETFGRTITLKGNETGQNYSEGQCVRVCYDPLNPDRSKLIFPHF